MSDLFNFGKILLPKFVQVGSRDKVLPLAYVPPRANVIRRHD